LGRVGHANNEVQEENARTGSEDDETAGSVMDVKMETVDTSVQDTAAPVYSAVIVDAHPVQDAPVPANPEDSPEGPIEHFIQGIKVQNPEPDSLDPKAEEFEIMNTLRKYNLIWPFYLFRSDYPPTDRPFVVLDGFDFCDMLDNATFFSDLELSISGMTSKLTLENAAHLVAYIDWSSQQMLAHPDFQSNFQRETKFTEDWSTDTLKRGVCWNVAQGNLQWWKPYVNFDQDLQGKHGGRVIRTIDSEAALHFLNYEGKQTPQDIANTQSRRHYRIAYVVMVHWNTDNVAVLLDAISDPTVFVYLHVDLSAPESYHREIHDIIEGRPDVAIMPTSFAVTWSHVSIVWVEMRAFFDLLDLISFDYVINLSGSDYPLKSADTIFRHLEKKPGSNWMWWMDALPGQMDWRIKTMYHCREYQGQWAKKCVFTDPPHGARSFEGYKQLFPKIWKTSQWVILHRSSVEYLRSSEVGKLLLMHSEHMVIPDEYFFPTLFAATPLVERTYRDPKRLMFWTGEPHPYEWKKEDASVIKAWAKHFLWIRKVDLSTDPELKGLLDDIRREDQMSNRMVVKYNEGRGVIPVD
jgi:hypothetical protein